MLKKGKYNSVIVARYIVSLANLLGQSINITKLQKLLYITYGVYLALKEKRLTNEQPQAWPYGPVFPNTREELLKVPLESISRDESELLEIKKDEELNKILGFVLKNFGSWTATELTEWSHKSDSPWDLTCHLPNFNWSMEISDETIFDYFNRLIKVS